MAKYAIIYTVEDWRGVFAWAFPLGNLASGGGGFSFLLKCKLRPFLKAYIAFTAPEGTDSQSMLQDGNPN